ncbi:MAG: branched-chain amino acid ABC transporter permease [Bdellovibrionales bacterium]|nr:branched-chain amino acid ABC transporter permease [Bdellovibrionales bacterium]
MEIVAQLFVYSILSGSIYALASSGLALVYGLLRVLNFAHGHLMMLGAYLFYFVHIQQAQGLWLSAAVTIAITSLLALGMFKVFVLPFTRFSLLLTLVTTLALSNILEAIVSMLFGVNVKSLSQGSFAESYQVAGIYITSTQVVIIGSALSLLSLLAYIIHSTSIGRKIRALSEHPYAAESIGISQKKISYLVFVIGTLLAAYAGILVGFETNMQPTMGNAYTIKAFAAMILGGLGNIWGAIVGSFILGFIENFSIGMEFGGISVPAGYKDAFAFAIILLVLLFRPQGLFGVKQRAS